MPVPIMFAITMQVAVSGEMRCGLLGMSAVVREKFGWAEPIQARGKVISSPARDNQTLRSGRIAIWQATIDTAPETRFTVNSWLEF